MDKLGRILIIDDNEDVLFALNLLLEPLSELVVTSTAPQQTERLISTYRPDIILLDMNFSRDASGGKEGMELLARILDADPAAVVIFITAYADTEKAVAAVKAGAADFIPKPWRREKLLATLGEGMALRRARSETQRNEAPARPAAGAEAAGEAVEVIGRSEAMGRVLQTIERVAATEANVLLLGENGTGKDVLARRLHRASTRAERPFVGIDLGGVPETLFESELFGYEKGAFTNAAKAKAGRMELASGGTLFLDEIGNLSMPMQAKLLTAIERRQIHRLGAVAATPIDVRLVCATNADIHERVGEGRFRQDLLYRINTVEVRIPPLRERGDDVLLLARHFLARYAEKYGKDITRLEQEAQQKLLRYDWPGNVRELQHTLERAVIMANGNALRADDLAMHARPADRRANNTLNLEQLEREAVERAMELNEGNLSRAAEALGITRYALYRKLKKPGI